LCVKFVLKYVIVGSNSTGRIDERCKLTPTRDRVF
jgi:hypothetical protein